jgi:C1A family cysteine protease
MSVGAVCAAESITDNTISNDSKEILQTVQEDITTDDSSDVLGTAQNDIYTASDDSFTNLTDEIKSKDVVDLTHNYKFNNETDASSGIVIAKDNFVLNGNGHTIDGNNQSRLLDISGKNITLNDLILINGNFANCGGMRAVESTLTLNNVTFINNHADNQGGAIGLDTTTLVCNFTRFIDSYAKDGPAILLMESEAKLYNSYITSKNYVKGSQIYLTTGTEAYIENTTFANIVSSYAPALNIKSAKASIINSRFIDLKANITAGAIRTKAGGELYIENCEFENVTSSKNGGAIFADVAGENEKTGKVTIIGSKFKDTYSEFGGAYVQLGGDLVLKNTEFTNNHAKYDGGAVYISYTNTEIDNCTFDSNGVSIIEGYPTHGAAIYSDMSTLNIDESKFFNNVASEGSAIYAYDNSYNIKNSIFENNTSPIYTVFDKESILENNTCINDDNVSTNNTYYATTIIGQGIQLVLLNNTISVENLPKKFDLRDWGWVSSVKNQAGMGACWTFGMTGTLESALLKAANITTDFSENNMQNTMLKYSIYGSTMIVEGGANCISTGYLLSWLGAFTQDADTYDEVGKISPVVTTQNDIHVQDVMFTPNKEIPNGTQLKLAIMNYGSIDVAFYGQSTSEDVNPYYNPETHAHYVDEPITPSHAVSIIGWDDNYNASNFLITPPGNGAWIVKNSYGTEWGENGFFYISYYDKTLLNSEDVTNYATSIIIENTEPYNKNYQYNLIWDGDFKSGNQNVSYMNVFEALDDDLIAGVGTYFDKEGNNYTVEIYVNDELKLTQTGVSPYYGYHTIKLNKYIPIKEGDVFKAVITSQTAPTVNLTSVRSHYTQNISYISFDGKSWKDAYDLGYIACLKAYTVADDSKIINNKNISVDYNGGKYFSVKVVTADGHAVGAGTKVTFTINKKTKTVKTNKNGIAKIKITDIPKKYTIKTKYNGKTYKNTVTVKQVLTASKVTVKKTAKKFTLKAKLKINGKLQKGKVIKFKINGKTYKVKTNAKGVAQKTLNKNALKLKKGKKYTVKVTYLKDTIKTTVKIK